MLGSVAGAKEFDLAVAGVSERHLELAVFDELAPFDPVRRRDSDMQERAGAHGLRHGVRSLATSRAGDRVLLRELQAELVKHIARDLLLDVGSENSFSTASSSRLLVSIVVS